MPSDLLFDDQVVHPTGRGALDVLGARVKDCQRCSHGKARKRILLGQGNTDRPLLAFVTDGPNEAEERTGKLLIGPPGLIFDKMLAGLNLTRDAVFLAPAVLCKGPYGVGHIPAPDAIKACRKFLRDTLHAVRPYVVVTLGGRAQQAVIAGEGNDIAARGRWSRAFDAYDLMLTLHPGYFARPPTDRDERPAWESRKGLVWEDLLRAYDRACALKRADPAGPGP